MLKSSDLYHLAFYQKSNYTGSIDGMRYYIGKDAAAEPPVFRVWIFPGPFCFEKTADDVKESKTFPFTEDSIPLIASWLNTQYHTRADYWHMHKSIL